VYALVLAHVNVGDSNIEKRSSGFKNLVYVTEIGEYRTVGAYTGIYKMQCYTIRSFQSCSNAFKDCWIGSTHVGYAFYPVAHVIR
jgi:hypothetical protein